MFFHSMKYMFLTLIRDKVPMFWCFAFPLLLATMFHFAFGNLNADEQFSPIPVAVIQSGQDSADCFENTAGSIQDTLDALNEPGENQFLRITYSTEEEALSLLENKEISGILSINDTSSSDAALRLSVSADMSSAQLEQSILSAFVTQFNLNYSMIEKAATSHPEKLPDLLSALTEKTDYLTEQSFALDSADQTLTYFFNLIAMVCMYAALIGSNLAVKNQANLSPLGARRNISPVHRMLSILGDLSAGLIFEYMTVFVTLLYCILILGVDFGSQFGYISLTALVGCITGNSLGFFIGCIGYFRKEVKFGILMGVIMLGSVLSGLMVGNMRIYIERFCPVINRLNPSALISDAFYSLTVYPSHERFYGNITGLLFISALLCLGSFVLVRRKKYASL